nr:MAG TPA: hypothetical protein [Bacteriophage sp.]
MMNFQKKRKSVQCQMSLTIWKKTNRSVTRAILLFFLDRLFEVENFVPVHTPMV